jgi:uncharacterized protein YhdP
MNDKHIKKIIDKQFKIANLDLRYEDVRDNQIPNWYHKYTYSSEDNEKWKNWTMRYMREKMKLTKDKALIETAWIDLNYGLRTSTRSVNNKKKK